MAQQLKHFVVEYRTVCDLYLNGISSVAPIAKGLSPTQAKMADDLVEMSSCFTPAIVSWIENLEHKPSE
ncbi:MAG TPA: hypothetical protein VG326_05280 [Tepidisphaeraceae bacterium]|jgi:hypothetical protein|nr:hypothetical protein [Tepidisphaeraceae bacterium]